MPRKKPTEKQIADLTKISSTLHWLLWHSHRLGYGNTAKQMGEALDEIAAAMGMPADYQQHMNPDMLFEVDEILYLDPSLPSNAERVAQWAQR